MATLTVLVALLALLSPANAGDDPLPFGAIKRFGTVRFRTGDNILSLTYSPDGKHLACGGQNDVVRLLDSDGRLVRTFKETWVWALAFSPDGKYLATGGAFKVVRLWDLETGKEVNPGKMAGHKGAVKTLVFAQEGGMIISAGDDGTIRSWNTADGSLIETREGHGAGVNALTLLPDDRTLVSAGIDRTIRFWGEKPIVLQAPSSIECLVCLNDKTVISGGDDGFIRVWDKDEARETRSWKAHIDGVTHLSLSADRKTLVSGGDGNEMHVWDPAKGKKLRSMPRSLGDSAALAMSVDGKTVATGGFNNTINRHVVATGKTTDASTNGMGAATSLVGSTDGSLLAAAFSTNQVHLLDFATGNLKHRLVCGPEDAELLLAISPDGQTLATVSLPNIILWSTANGKEKRRITLTERDEVRCVSFSPDGKELAVGFNQGGLRLWNAITGAAITQKAFKQKAFPNGVWSIAYSAGGKTLAVGMKDAIVLLDTKTFEPVLEYGKVNDTVSCLAFAPDGRHLAAGMFAGTIRLFDLKDPGDLPDFEPRNLEGGHQGVVTSIGWSANGRCLVTGGVDRTVRLWEFVNGQMIAKWDGHQGEVSAAAFHPLGRRVTSASCDTTLLVWDTTLGTSLDPKGLDPANLDQLWDDLASENNALGNKALWTAVASARDSVAYLSKKVFVADPKKIEQCIKDLDSKKFKERQLAESTLAGYGRWVEGTLRSALKDRPPEEARQRIVLLLERLEGKNADGKNSVTFQQERLRMRRIIEILEQAATPAAHDLLQMLASGAAEVELRDMAQAALQRKKE